MLVTAWVGMYLADQHNFVWRAWLFGTLGIACMASAAAVINHIIDRKIDRNMSRTALRPIAARRVTPRRAILFAISLACIGWLLLSIFVNTLTAILTFATLIGYAGIYTIYLKHATPQNIVIGGLAGAMPPLLGWAAVSGDINPYSLLLVLIIFTWTPPHFWALAIYRVQDYKSANIPMLPVTHGIAFTKLSLLLYTLLLLAVSVLPFVVGLTGTIYLIAALILNMVFIYLAIALYRSSENNQHRLAIRTFNFSIIYLLLLFTVLLLDSHTLGGSI
jgi:protoheme IX farnesyltransferase